MPKVMSGDVALYYEEAGEGTPILFLHEFLNDYSGWQDQMRHFSRGYRCISYSARGVPPSDVPDGAAAYSQEHFNADALALLDRLGIDRAHLVGLSMGAYTALQLALNQPERVLGVVAASGASGGLEATRAAYEAET
ncbi:MAG: alpha/beta fold hydrolase, partial [Alphaproteobacteria bacterium]